jgi:hypothetical protein
LAAALSKAREVFRLVLFRSGCAARLDFNRAANLAVTSNAKGSEYERRQAALLAARADVTGALAHRTRCR